MFQCLVLIVGSLQILSFISSALATAIHLTDTKLLLLLLLVTNTTSATTKPKPPHTAPQGGWGGDHDHGGEGGLDTLPEGPSTSATSMNDCLYTSCHKTQARASESAVAKKDFGQSGKQ